MRVRKSTGRFYPKNSEMLANPKIIIALLFIPLAAAIIYMDIRYRRIPNNLVLLTLIAGIALNFIFRGRHDAD